jgi:hypothetical protein
MAAQTPSARPRRSPWNVAVTTASAAGESNAAPTPCSARPAMSMVPLPASPHISEAAVNSPSPARSVRRAPNASDSRPPSTIRPPKQSVYVVTTHVSDSRSSARSVPMVGNATCTTVMSTISMNCARHSRTSTPHPPARSLMGAVSRLIRTSLS